MIERAQQEELVTALIYFDMLRRGRSVIAGFDWIDSTHRFLAGFLFDDMCHQPRRSRDHENTVKRGDSFEIGKDGAAAGGSKRRGLG